MSFPKYNDILNEYRTKLTNEYMQDKELIKKAMSEYYIDKMRDIINTHKYEIANGSGFAVHLRTEDINSIKDKNMLCSAMNEILYKYGFKYNVKLSYYYGGQYDTPTEYCSFK
jgi:hypothetical protein